MLMTSNKSETTGHGCPCPGDEAVHMRKVLTRPWVGVCVPLQLFFIFYFLGELETVIKTIWNLNSMLTNVAQSTHNCGYNN